MISIQNLFTHAKDNTNESRIKFENALYDSTRKAQKFLWDIPIRMDTLQITKRDRVAPAYFFVFKRCSCHLRDSVPVVVCYGSSLLHLPALYYCHREVSEDICAISHVPCRTETYETY